MEQAPEAPESIAPWTVQQALEQARARGLERIDAQMLLLHALGRPLHDRAWLLTHDTDTLPASVQAQYTALCARRQAGEPVAYLTGRKAFYGLELQVDARVLDPRPDTETLVDWALQLLQARTAPRIVDLGTGSGAIALALQSQRPDARVLAVDASAGALAVAQANAARLHLPVQCLQGDWLQGLQGPFDAIVANPPYIPQADPHLAALRHEPLAALARAPTAWRTCAPSSPRPRPAWRRAAGCCSSTAGTRPRPSAPCCRRPALPPCKHAKTSPASCVARAGNGQG